VWSAEAVFVCALGLLGRSASSLPPVNFVEHAPPGASALAQGYVLRTAPQQITLVTSTEAFTNARSAVTPCLDVEALREIASVIVHEEWHVRHGPGEAAAYDAQLTALLSFGAEQDGALYHKIFRAKLAVVAAERRNARAQMLARSGR